MLARLINRLRKELTPLVSVELRAQLEPEIRAEIMESTRRSFEQDALRDAAPSLIHDLQRVAAEARDAGAVTAREVKSQLLSTITGLSPELLTRMDVALDSSIASKIEPLRQDLVTKLTPEVRRNLEESIRLEVQVSVDTEKQRMQEAARDQILLDYLIQNSGHDIERFVEGLPLRLRLEAKTAIRQKLSPVIVEELRNELRDDVRQQAMTTLTPQVRLEMLQNPEMRTEVRKELRRELAPQVKAELMVELRPIIEGKLSHELKLPVLLDKSGNIEGTVAGVLRRNLAASMEEIRQAVDDETWALVSAAIFEGFGAAEAIKEKKWEHYCSIARDLIDDRIYSPSDSQARRLKLPSGFYRAVQRYFCSRTGNPIEPGDYYLVFRGLRIGLPLQEEIAKELVEDTQGAPPENSGTEIEPPWSGLPLSE